MELELVRTGWSPALCDSPNITGLAKELPARTQAPPPTSINRSGPGPLAWLASPKK